MAHLMTGNDYKAIRDNKYCLITFKDGKRKLTYGGLPAHRLIEETIIATERGLVCKVYADGTEPKHYSWDIKDYE